MFLRTNVEIPSAKTIISTVASATATAMLIRSLAKDYLPREVRHYFVFKVRSFLKSFTSEITLVIEEYDNLNQNHLFKAAQLYMEPIIPPDTLRLKVSLTKKESQPSLSLEENQEVVDTFKGAVLKWKFISSPESGRGYVRDPNHCYNPLPITEKRYFELRFHKKHKSLVLDEYIKHVLGKSKDSQEKKKTIKLFKVGGGGRGNGWQGVNLDHPMTFDTVAMDLEVKKMIIEDLERFVRRREFYRKVGKAWKRGYLLFGPPGTGKSSLIAAMANYLKFDIYDLELTELRGNSELRMLLTSTANRSILVVEDIDCSIEFHDRHSKRRAASIIPAQMCGFKQPYQPEVTLSGFLNFIDGLWSSCGDERIIIFTTNFKEKLDPALLRPGRMDVHIHMSYCTPTVFKLLASNYLGITTHPLYPEIEEMIKTTNVTPAEVAEQLIKSEEPEISLRGLITFLQDKKIEESAKTQASGSGLLQENPEAAETNCLKLLEDETEIKPNSNLTPAEARGQLMKSDDPEVAMRSLLKLFQDNKIKIIQVKYTRGDGTSGKIQV